MQKILGYMRKAIQDYNLIQDGDRIAVGVSGGKDSLALLIGLKLLQRFIGIDYEIIGITLDPYFNKMPTDFSSIQKLCEQYDIQYKIIETHIAEIIFDIRKKSHPCSLCARMRRGALHDAAKENNCNKIALGHNFDDAIETFFMNLFNEGRLGCFSPVSYLSRKDLYLIRPLVYAPEKDIKSSVKRNDFPVVKSTCIMDGNTNREKTKQFIKEMSLKIPDFSEKIFGAMKRADLDGFGDKKHLFAEKNNPILK